MTTYDYKKYAILVVDDEAQTVKYFAKAFEAQFRVLTAMSVDEAIAVLNAPGSEVAIVITDQRMPMKTGVELLTYLRQNQPEVIRILTTAYSDIQSAIDAVNSGAIYKYVVKPWELQDLKITLMRAMEFYLVQRERNLLFKEKLAVIQRLMVADRVKSLAALAAGLSHHIRNSMTALHDYLEQTPDMIKEELDGKMAKNPQFWTDSWASAKNENAGCLSVVQHIADAVAHPSYTFADTSDLEDLIQTAAQSVKRAGGGSKSIDVALDIATELPMFKVDRELIEKMLTALIERTAMNSQPGSRLFIHATDKVDIWGTPGIRISISGEGPAWAPERVAAMFSAFNPSSDDPKDLGLDLLSAFFVAYHHGGELAVHRTAPNGPGFELRLPFAPLAVNRPTLQEDMMEKLFLRFDLWSQHVN